jgi:hypothetical protein
LHISGSCRCLRPGILVQRHILRFVLSTPLVHALV